MGEELLAAPDVEKPLTAREAAAFLKISVAAFHKWRRRHDIPNRAIGRLVRVYRADLLSPDAKPPVDYEKAGIDHARGVEQRRA
jgi:excisionase family DNA binding protein